jgi:hypothetical protein
MCGQILFEHFDELLSGGRFQGRCHVSCYQFCLERRPVMCAV